MNNKAAKILLIDDNADMRDLICSGLKMEGYNVNSVASLREMMSELIEYKPDAILLDLILPDGNGLSMMEKIRSMTDAPVLVVSGKGDLVDKVVGFEMGADDYISKPFQVKELVVRVKAQLRRYQNTGKTTAKAPDLRTAEKISFGDWVMDRPRLQVYDKNEVSAGLTVKEFRLLEVFLESPNFVLSRDQLLDRSRMLDTNVTDRAIDTQITRIRKKLGDTFSVGNIVAVRGAGYMYSGPVNVFTQN